MSAKTLLFDRVLCLRTDHAHYECDACVAICPENALSILYGRITLNAEACTGCGACVGGCPTEALTLEGIEAASAILRKAMTPDTPLSCEAQGYCLALFGVEHWIALGFKAPRPVTVDLSGCSDCPLDREGRLRTAIESRLGEAADFITTAGGSSMLTPSTAKAENSRRSFFKNLVGNAKELAVALPDLPQETAHAHTLPTYRTLFKTVLAGHVEQLHPIITFASSTLSTKTIDAFKCTNCRDCVSFCPTGALSYDGSGTQILFQLGKCIHCHICHMVCAPEAINIDTNIDLIALAFDRARVLVEHRMEPCSVCRTPFSQKAEESICPRCIDYHKTFPDMFKTAEEFGL